MGVAKVEVQKRQKRPLNGAWKGKQVFNNNREGSLERTYAKAQKHKAQWGGWTSLGQRLWPEIVDDDGGSTCQFLEELSAVEKIQLQSFYIPGRAC